MHVGLIKINCDDHTELRLTIPTHKIKIVRGPHLGFCGPLDHWLGNSDLPKYRIVKYFLFIYNKFCEQNEINFQKT